MRNMLTKIKIEKIFVHGNQLCVKPIFGKYDKIYRSGMSVGWNETLSCFIYTGRETSYEESIKIICTAVENEYGVVLFTDSATIVNL